MAERPGGKGGGGRKSEFTASLVPQGVGQKGHTLLEGVWHFVSVGGWLKKFIFLCGRKTL